MSPEMSPDEIIKEFWNDKNKTYDFIGEMCVPKLSGDAVRKRGRDKLGLPPRKINSQNRKLSAEGELERDITLLSAKKREQTKDTKLQSALKEIDTLRKHLEASKAIKDIQTFSLVANKLDGSESTAFAIASDWHYWETVNPEQIDFLNEFNKDIAQKRAANFFTSTVKLLKGEQARGKINTLVLALLGDFISGNIHDELMESNQGLVIDELMAVQSAIASGIEYLLKNTNVDIVIPCHSGNHGRATEKRRIATEAGNSFEYLMYHNLASYFKDEKRVKFLISKGYLSYLDVSGYIIRFHHGHALRYAGGIGGIFIPAFKAISQWDKSKRADLTVFGHFHQIKDGGNFISNGSLVGYNDFALVIKADYEKPKQVFFLVNHQRKEKTTTCPIFLE